ncbi:MAG: protein BatD [Bacteroidetes bacterium]|nr:protein BatD [Bacteroidota bacterium]
MRLILFLLVSSLFTGLRAQEIELAISTDRTTYRVNDIVTVTLEVATSGNVNLPEPTLSPVQGLKRLPGQSSSGQSISIVNGSYRVSTTQTHTYLATETGTLKVGPATVVFKGKTVQSNLLTLKIVAADAKLGSETGQEQDELVFIKATANKTNPVVGEPVYIKYRLYFRTRINNPRQVQDFTISGALTDDVNTGVPNQRPQNEVVGGITYSAVNIRELVIYPQQPGLLEIKPLVLTVQAARPRKNNRSSVFDDFLMDPFQEYTQISVSSNSLKLTVRPTGPLPADYTGFVGDITGKRTVSRQTAEVNQPVSVFMTFEGTGNFKNFLPPKLSFGSQVEAYPPKETTKMNAGVRGGTGTWSIEYIIIPRYSGDINLPAVSWSWWDSGSDKVKTQTFPAITIPVTGGAAANGLPTGESIDFRTIGKDISFIRTESDWSEASGFRKSPHQWAIPAFLMMWAIFGMAFVWLRRSDRLRADYKSFAHRHAEKFARKSLEKARKLAETTDTREVLGEIHRVISQFIAHKLKIGETAWTASEVIQLLSSQNMPPEQLSRVSAYLHKLNEYRFAPVQAITESKEELIKHAEIILADLSAFWS